MISFALFNRLIFCRSRYFLLLLQGLKNLIIKNLKLMAINGTNHSKCKPYVSGT